ncbi:MAG: toprim domain-containing protein [Candidatus Brocadiia bacterium]
MKIREHAKGRWPEIISELLGEKFANVRKHQPCPCGDGKDRYRFSDVGGTGQYHCACSDGSRDGFQLLQCAKGVNFAEAAKMVEGIIGKAPGSDEPGERPATRAEKLRPQTIKTLRSAYLERRGLEIAPGLDWHRGVEYFDAEKRSQGFWPAMLAPVVRDGRWLTYHATFLEPGGRKAPLDPARKILPARGSLSGAACPLYRAGKVLGIAEGVETAIAARMLHDIPTWAALNTALLGEFRWPPGTEKLVIFADNDRHMAGHAAAYKLAHRALLQGLEVDIRIPERVGADWNDVLLEVA